MSTPFIDITNDEMDGLLQRIQHALDEQLSLTPEDIRLILSILRHFAFMQEKLESNATMKQKYLKLLGLVNNSETQDKLLGQGSSEKKPPRTREKKPASKVTIPTKVCHHNLEGLEKGQLCPECEKGKLHKTEPASFIRLVGSPPLTRENHVMEQLRCATCGRVFTAELPPEVAEDGLRGQKYGYSARAMIGLGKFFMGSPYYRQGSLQQLLGGHLSASSAFDQCRLVANDAAPVLVALQALAADAPLFYIDDTSHKILDQTPIEKPNRNGRGTRLRSGVYTSGLIATLSTGHHAVLFQTNIGHAGEWIDDILRQRDTETLSAPQVMSDALSGNRPTVVTTINLLCNAHGRRKFTDIIDNFPEEVAYVLERYGKIWSHEHEAKEKELSPAARRDYHHSHSLPIMEGLRDWGRTQLAEGKVEANSGLGTAIKYLDNHFEGLTAFCYHEGAPLDNNFMEGVFKFIANSRKNFYFYKTLAGAQVGDAITSIIATCEANGVNAFDYLVAIQRYHFEVSRDAKAWLPWNYAETLATLGKTAA